jgi:hypothetical protein
MRADKKQQNQAMQMEMSCLYKLQSLSLSQTDSLGQTLALPPIGC